MEILSQTPIKMINIIPAIIIILIGLFVVFFLNYKTGKYFKKAKDIGYVDTPLNSGEKQLFDLYMKSYHLFNKITAISAAIVLIISLITMILCSTVFGITVEGKYSYKVKIDDSVSMNEIYDKYTNIREIEPGVYQFEDK